MCDYCGIIFDNKKFSNIKKENLKPLLLNKVSGNTEVIAYLTIDEDAEEYLLNLETEKGINAISINHCPVCDEELSLTKVYYSNSENNKIGPFMFESEAASYSNKHLDNKVHAETVFCGEVNNLKYVKLF